MRKMILLLILMWVITSCSHKKEDTAFTVVLEVLPDSLNVRDNSININSYIIGHLYYPLMERSGINGYSSKFLLLSETRAIDEEFKTYSLCLKPDVEFSDGGPILVSDLIYSIGEFHKAKKHISSPNKIARQNKRCIQLEFNESNPFYFDSLLETNSTIVKESSALTSFPIGLGPYSIKEVNEKRISLRSLHEVDFMVVEFALRNNLDSSELMAAEDINPAFNIGEELLQKRNDVQLTRPGAGVLGGFIRIYDDSHRKRVAKCLPWGEMLGALQLDMVRTSNLILFEKPVELDSLFDVDCSDTKKSIPFLLAREKSKQEVSKLLQRYRNIGIDPVQTSTQAVLDALEGSTEFIAILKFGHVEDEPVSVFQGFMGENNYFRRRLPELERQVKEYQKLQLRSDGAGGSLEKAQLTLLKSGFVIPIGRLVDTIRFPKNLYSIEWLSKTNRYPKIWKIKRKGFLQRLVSEL